MSTYTYTGRSIEGAVTGVLEGLSASAVADTLMSRGITPLTIQTQARQAAEGPRFDLKKLFEPTVTEVDLLLFSRQLHTLMKSGVPILRALAGLQDSAANPRMKQTLQEVRHSLESGIDLARSLAQQGHAFDSFYVSLVRVGEMTGRLQEVFLRLFHHLEFQISMRQQVKAALRYPTFVVAAMVIAVGVINVMVIPAFAEVFKSFNATLPLATRALLAMSDFTLKYGLVLSGAVVAGVWTLRRWMATPVGRLAWDRFILTLPLAGRIVRKSLLARFARSLALTLKSGVAAEQALSVVAQTVDNAYMAQKMEGMRDSVERGESILRAAIAAGIFTPIVLQMIAVGEETGAVDELMDEVADLYTNEVQYELKTLGQQIEPVLIIFLGVLVLILALGVFLPVWDLGRTAFKQ